MVKVTVAGANGKVARAVIEKILAKNHEVITLTHRPVDSQDKDGAVKRVHVDYENEDQLAEVLSGTQVVLSFLATVDFDASIRAQKNLINASIRAGVRRFAPSEWACPDNTDLPHYHWKDAVRAYLEEINRDEKKIEYTLFQPGLFTDFFAYPRPATHPFAEYPWSIDFEKRRAIVVGDGNQHFTTTTVGDLASVVAEAIDYEGEWPTRGGVAGCRVTVSDIVALAEKTRGPIEIERLNIKDLEAGEFKASWSWLPLIEHASLTPERAKGFTDQIMIAYELSTAKGAWDGSDEWNQRLPNLKFTSAEEFLTGIWSDDQ